MFYVRRNSEKCPWKSCHFNGKKPRKRNVCVFLFFLNTSPELIYLSSYSTMLFQITPHGILIGIFNAVQTGLIYDCNKELPN